MYLAVDDVCNHYTVQQGSVVHEEEADLACTHEEMDTRIVFPLSSLLTNDNPTVTVRCSDTGVFVLLLYHSSQTWDNHKPLVWMDVGLSANNTRHYINISQMVEQFDRGVLEALPALHAYTGLDYTATFINKGKIRPFGLMKKNQRVVRAFGSLGSSDTVDDNTMTEIEKFTCCMYSRPKLSKVNDVGLALFEQKYAPTSKATAHPLDKMKGVNPSGMPPCHSSLVNKVRRANYIAYLWKNASNRNPSDLNPEEHGWLLKDNQYVIN